MRQASQTFFVNVDFLTLCLYLALVGIGWLSIYAVDVQQGDTITDLAGFLRTSAGKQTIWILISLFVFAVITMVIDQKFWVTFAYLLYGLGLVLLVLVLFMGSTIKGATSWFNFGGFSFQPSEIAKFGTALALASFLNHWNTDLRQTSSQVTVLGMLLAPMALILLQPDAGSALVFLSFFILLFREGLAPMLYVIAFYSAAVLVVGLLVPTPLLVGWLIWLAAMVHTLSLPYTWRWMGGLAIVGVLLGVAQSEGWVWPSLGILGAGFLVLSYWQYQRRQGRMALLLGGLVLWGGLLAGATNYAFNNVLKPHQQERINVWLQPGKCDPRGSLYNVMQSKLAISAGGLTGKGLLQGALTRGKHVPEQSTDFIFCTIGEEHGFVGSASVVILFLLLLLRISFLAERQPTTFARAYAYGVGGIIFIHFVVNIGMTMGLLPIIGIPLPFISKGGSSLLGFTVLLAVLLKLDKHRGRIKAGRLSPF